MRRPAWLRRTKPLARTGLRRRISPKTRDERQDAQAVVEKVYARDGGCLLRGHQEDGVAGPCRGPLTPHHLRKASRRGGCTLANLVALCAGHNVWVEDHPVEAWTRGLVVWDGETTAEAWQAMREAGLPVSASPGASCSGGGRLIPPLHRHQVDTCERCGAVVAVDAADNGGLGGRLGFHHLEGVA